MKVVGMNITLRKLAMLEKSIAEQEERARVQGYSSVVIDNEMKKRITDLMDKVRVI